MKWRLGRIQGIDLYVHFTFLILLGWLLLSRLGAGIGLNGALQSVFFTISVFGVVVLHELGHAMAARKFGIPTRDITLYPIGGVARLERMPDDPKQELIVAGAGPAVNVVLAGVLWLLLSFSELFITPFSPGSMVPGFLANLIGVNLVLAVFNLLPAFPMDGGRILRAFLAGRMDYVRATNIAATAGKGMAVIFGLLGLMGNPMLLLIAFFVWSAGSSEAFMVRMKYQGFQGLWNLGRQAFGRGEFGKSERFKSGDDITDGSYRDISSKGDKSDGLGRWFKGLWRDEPSPQPVHSGQHVRVERRRTPNGVVEIYHYG